MRSLPVQRAATLNSSDEGTTPARLSNAPAPEAEIYANAIPCILASCLVATIVQEERDCGFGFARYGGNGFADFTAPAELKPDNQLEYISNHAVQVVTALDVILRAITQRVVIKD